MIMNPFIIAITLILILAIGYILSRPFLNAHTMPESSATTRDYLLQYETLLSEINELEATVAQSGDSKDTLGTIETKKHIAAALLKKINPLLVADQMSITKQPATEQSDGQAQIGLPLEEADYCPCCGSDVLDNDKFCTHCGYPL